MSAHPNPRDAKDAAKMTLERPRWMYELSRRVPSASASFVRLPRARRLLRGGHPLELECLRETESEVAYRDPVAAHCALREQLRCFPFRQEPFAGQSRGWPLRGLANASMHRRHHGPGDDERPTPVHAQRRARTQDISTPEPVPPSQYAVAVDSPRLLLLALYSLILESS
jgi:hypothetical protein